VMDWSINAFNRLSCIDQRSKREDDILRISRINEVMKYQPCLELVSPMDFQRLIFRKELTVRFDPHGALSGFKRNGRIEFRNIAPDICNSCQASKPFASVLISIILRGVTHSGMSKVNGI
jgi:hypothetical protein